MKGKDTIKVSSRMLTEGSVLKLGLIWKAEYTTVMVKNNSIIQSMLVAQPSALAACFIKHHLNIPRSKTKQFSRESFRLRLPFAVQRVALMLPSVLKSLLSLVL